MEIINNQDEWNKLIIENNGDFLQSWGWGEIQKQINPKTKIFRLKTGNLTASLVISFNKTVLYYLYYFYKKVKVF
ncbi:MAG: hypothetical protein ACP5IC_00175 [Minisyncoccia bacterium]